MIELTATYTATVETDKIEFLLLLSEMAKRASEGHEVAGLTIKELIDEEMTQGLWKSVWPSTNCKVTGITECKVTGITESGGGE